MGRMYAGVLGPLAFTTILARSLVHGSGAEATLKTAILCLFAFTVIGYVAGRIADSIVIDSVRARFQEELQTRETAATEKATQQS